MAVACMSIEADSLINRLDAARVAMSIENSLVWPSLKPTSQEVDLDLQIGLIIHPKTTGLTVTTKRANTKHCSHTDCIRGKLKLAPIEKKNRTKKKSLMGFRLIAMY